MAPPESGSSDPEQPPTLSYVDFTPILLRPATEANLPIYGRFDTLVEKANSWLEENPTVRVKTCESLSRIGDGKSLVEMEDCSSINRRLKTRMVRCFRLWFTHKKLDEGSEEQNDRPQKLAYFDMLPQCSDESSNCQLPEYYSFRDTVTELNSRLLKDPLEGRILNVETVLSKIVNMKTPDPDHPTWSTFVTGGFAVFLHVIRVYYEITSCHHEQIGFIDFIPDCLQPHIYGKHGTFMNSRSTLADAQAWLRRHPNLRITNLQSMEHQLHFGKPLDTLCTLSTEPCAGTNFVRVLRLYYIRRKRIGEQTDFQKTWSIDYKTFVPCKLTRERSTAPAKYETLRQTVTRASSWLRFTDADILSVETIQLTSGFPRASFDPENTFTENQHSSQQLLWVIRVYLRSTYVEPAQQVLPPEPILPMEQKRCCTVS